MFFRSNTKDHKIKMQQLHCSRGILYLVNAVHKQIYIQNMLLTPVKLNFMNELVQIDEDPSYHTKETLFKIRLM